MTPVLAGLEIKPSAVGKRFLFPEVVHFVCQNSA